MVPPHNHPEAESITVLAGPFGIVQGTVTDRSKGKVNTMQGVGKHEKHPIGLSAFRSDHSLASSREHRRGSTLRSFRGRITALKHDPRLRSLFRYSICWVLSRQQLSYGATIDNSGFTGSMSGSYGGQTLAINYSAQAMAAPFTWASTGSYGGEPWSSDGSASFSFPTSTTFQVQYNESVNLGPNTGQSSLVISGIKSVCDLHGYIWRVNCQRWCVI
jgi:hypothetical protein